MVLHFVRRAAGLVLIAFAVTSPCGDGFAAEPQAEQGVLLLKSGRLVHGAISESSGGFVVELKNGRMLVPFNQVEMQAGSAHEVYYKLRKNVPPGAVNYRLSLATWCLNNKLYNQARNEVQSVLKAEPQNPTAGRMLTRIDALLDTKRETPKQPASPYERLFAPEAKSLAGLSPGIATTFVSRVQPILMNNCALSGCHGPRAESGFVLLRVHLTSGSRRNQSEQNLSAALKYIDIRDAEASPLLKKPQGGHGRRGRTIFRGRAGSRQLSTLRSWVQAVAGEMERPAGSRTATSTKGRGPQFVNSSSARPSREPAVTPQLRAGFGNGKSDPPFQLTPSMRAARSRLKSAKGVRNRPAARKKNPAGDPFDPEEFNRQTGPASRGPRQPSPLPGTQR